MARSVPPCPSRPTGPCGSASSWPPSTAPAKTPPSASSATSSSSPGSTPSATTRPGSASTTPAAGRPSPRPKSSSPPPPSAPATSASAPASSRIPYHHPFHVADRMVLLDHLTRGRVMLGVGPGALPSDAKMLAIDPPSQRELMEEASTSSSASSGVSRHLHRTGSTSSTGVLQLRPFTFPHPEVCVRGDVLAGQPREQLQVTAPACCRWRATQQEGGFDALGTHWGVIEERVEGPWHHTGPGAPGDYSWDPMHLAETEDDAIADVGYGLRAGLRLPEPRHPHPARRAPGSLDERIRRRQTGWARLLRRDTGDGEGADPAPPRPVGRLRLLPLHGRRLRLAGRPPCGATSCSPREGGPRTSATSSPRRRRPTSAGPEAARAPRRSSWRR